MDNSKIVTLNGQNGNVSPELTEPQAVRLTHRKKIGGRVETLLNNFYRRDLGKTFDDAELIEWIDVLEPLPRDAINKACVDWHQNGPRSQAGKLIKPAPGDIYQRAKQFMPAPEVAVVEVAPEPQRIPPTKESQERVQALVEKAGFGLRRVDGFRASASSGDPSRISTNRRSINDAELNAKEG